MARISDIQAGLEIFRRLEGDSYHIAAEHDIIFAGRIPEKQLPKEDALVLQKSGWSWNEDEESWYHFV